MTIQFGGIAADVWGMKTGTATQLVTWSEKYSVGIASIDSEHQRLIGLVNDLYSAMLEGRGKDAMGKILDGLAAYTVGHFAREEKLMQAHSYSGYQAHKVEHDKLTAQVKQLQADARAGKAVVSMDVMRFLQHWLVDHIVGVDKKYTAHLTAAGVK